LKKHQTGELHKKVTILKQAPQITLFLTHPVGIIENAIYAIYAIYAIFAIYAIYAK